mgnify:CR=1 FL=1
MRKAIALAEPLLNFAGQPIVAPNSTSLPEIENPDFPVALRDAGLRILVPLAVEGRAVAAFALASMLAAALVLLASKPSFWFGAAVQGVPPAIALAALAAARGG